MTLCPECFAQYNSSEGCPSCGCQVQGRRSSLLLPQGTVLRGQYVIGKVLGSPGGFGITYLGYNQLLECKVAIKEFLPRELAGRSLDEVSVQVHTDTDEPAFRAGLLQFLQEARLLAKFPHPNIVRVRDFFEENGTAYLVMDYYTGVTLLDYVEQHGGYLSEQAALDILLPIFDGLSEVHAGGVLHRDIKPQNIYITSAGLPILLDFGSARHTLEAVSQGFTLLVTPGFAPIEQYDRQGKQGPWTDVYGCAATLYYMLTGSVPPDAVSRMGADPIEPTLDIRGVSPGVRQGLGLGLALLPESRPQTIAEFRACLLSRTYTQLPNRDWREAATQLLPADSSTANTVRLDLNQTAELQPPRERSHAGRRRKAIMFVLLALIGLGIWQYWQASHPPSQVENKEQTPVKQEPELKPNPNSRLAQGVLTPVPLAIGEVADFPIDLLGEGTSQQLSLIGQGSRAELVISQNGLPLATLTNLKADRWYTAYLRGTTPDLIYFHLTGADFLEEVKIVGKTRQGTLGVLFAPDLGELRRMGLLRGQAGIELEGTRLILFSGKNRVAVEWIEQQQAFQMKKIKNGS